MTKDSAGEIAILVLDTAIEGITERFGDFGDNATHVLSSAVANQADELGPTHYDFVKYQIAHTTEASIYLESLHKTFQDLTARIEQGIIKGILLTGSRSDAFRTDIPWLNELNTFIKDFLLNLEKFPIVGICFGHQIIARNLNAKIGRNDAKNGWELGITKININPDILYDENSPFHEVFDEKTITTKELHLVESHQDIVYELPKPYNNSSFASIGSTNKCEFQGFLTKSGPLKILTFQGHPEFSTDLTLELLNRDYRLNYITEQEYRDFTDNTKLFVNQGPVVGKVINRFFHRVNN